jgi:glycosyltransferase involved in cell wall biosynthesis
MIRLAYLVTHPIQYQAPLLRRVAAMPGVELTVFFASDFSARAFVDPDMGQAVSWDVPLLDGYKYEVLDAWTKPLAPGEVPSVWRPFSKGLGRKLVNFDVLWVHGWNRASHWQALVAAKARGLEVLMRDEPNAQSAPRSGLKKFAKKLFFKLMNRFVDAWMPIGRLNRDYYRMNGIPERKLFDMPYAVDNAFFQAKAAEAAARREDLRASLGLEAGRPIVLFAAKLIDRKAPLDLLEAFAKIAGDPVSRRPYLLFAGDGALRAAIEERIAVQAIPGATVLGFQSQAQLAALYDLCDLFVLPSERETWGLVVNEAMNAGRAIICSDRIGSAADLVKPGENGAIFPYGDVDALADRLQSCLSDPARLAAMGRASRAIIDRWSFNEDIKGLEAALTKVTGKKFA